MIASQSVTSVPDISASHFCAWEWTIVFIFGNQSTVTTGITHYVWSYLLVHSVCLKICNICTRRFCITHLNLWMNTTVYFWTPVYCWHIVWFVRKYLDCIYTIANLCPPCFPEVHVCSTFLKACWMSTLHLLALQAVSFFLLLLHAK